MKKDIADIIKNAPYCDKEESEEITKIFDNLTEEDLEIVEEHKLIERRQIRPIVLNRNETKALIRLITKAKSELPIELIKCLHECISQNKYDFNILCRLTKDSYEKTVRQLKGE